MVNNKQCPNCKSFNTIGAKGYIFSIGLSLVLTSPWIALIGIILLPLLFLAGLLLVVGAIMIIASPFMRGNHCRACKFNFNNKAILA